EFNRLIIARAIRSLQRSIDHVEVWIAVRLCSTPQHVIGIHVDGFVGRAVLLEANKIVQVDVVQIEFEVVTVIVKAVNENRNSGEGCIYGAVDCVNERESERVYLSACLEKTQLLIRTECKRCAHSAIRHDHTPIVTQQVIQYSRQILLDETACVRVINHVVGGAQTEYGAGVLCPGGMTVPAVGLTSQSGDDR